MFFLDPERMGRCAGIAAAFGVIVISSVFRASVGDVIIRTAVGFLVGYVLGFLFTLLCLLLPVVILI